MITAASLARRRVMEQRRGRSGMVEDLPRRDAFRVSAPNRGISGERSESAACRVRPPPVAWPGVKHVDNAVVSIAARAFRRGYSKFRTVEGTGGLKCEEISGGCVLEQYAANGSYDGQIAVRPVSHTNGSVALESVERTISLPTSSQGHRRTAQPSGSLHLP